MKRKVAWTLLTLGVLVGASLGYIPSASSSSSSSSSDRRTSVARAFAAAANLNLALAITFDVDRTDDTAAATACTAAPNDCSLRGAIIAANADAGAAPVVINLQPATTYNLTLTNATQENAAATGDLDITTNLHAVTVTGGGSSGPNASVIDAAGLNTGSVRDRVFHITGPGVAVAFQDLAVRNGRAADDGTGGASTNPAAQNANRAGGGILNNGGGLTLTNVAIQSCQALGKGDSLINEHTTLDAHGGGLASLAATGVVVITGSTLTGNTAAGGDGGNFNNGAGSNARGGSLYFEGGTLDIDASRIENSAATGGDGGSVDQNGQTNGGSGGIAQGGGAWVGGGTVTINNTTFENTTAGGGDSGTGGNGVNPGGGADGGGLYSLANVTVTNSTFHLAAANGGDGGDAFGSTCLGAHNAGDGGGARGGAIFADGGSLVVNTATFADNSAAGGDGGDGGQTNVNPGCGMHGAGGLAHGGAIANNAAAVNIRHATVSLNNAQAGNTGVNRGGANKPPRPAAEGTGGGIRVGPGGATLENTIIAGNAAANGAGDAAGAPTPGPNVDGNVTSNGHNLLGVAAEASGFTGAGDQTGANPLLAPPADNGGPTQTMALLPGSPAIDAGVAAGATLDQRGQPRTVDDPGVANAATGDGTDIGAYEAPVVCSLSCPADINVPNDADACGAVVNYATPSGDGCGVVTCDRPSGSFFGVGETTVVCTSPAGPTCSFKVTVGDAQNPTVSAPPDASYQCAGEVPPASGSQATAADNCGTPTVVASDTTNGGAGSPASPLIITRTYTATDGAGLTASASQTITVIDNTPPAVACPPDIVVDAPAGECSASVNFAVTADDNCSAPAVVTSHASGSSFPVGTTTVVATATDAAGNSQSCSFKVTVKDAAPPVITTSGQTVRLWPPDHRYATVNVTDFVVSAGDACDSGVGVGGVRIAKVTSDEPENGGGGDGNTTDDIVIAADCKSVRLRSERAGGGNGRVYTITFKVTDASGNVSTATAKVTVPKSQNGAPAVDDGPQYTVSGGCP